MALHHAAALAQLAGARQRAREGPERLLVARSSSARGCSRRARVASRGEAQPADAREPVEGLRRPASRGTPATHDGALGARRARRARRRRGSTPPARRDASDARRPPTTATPCAARGSPPTRRRAPAASTVAAAAPRPRTRTPPRLRVQMYCAPCGETTSTGARVADRELHHARHEHARRRHHEPAGAPQRALLEALRRAVPDRPPRRRRRADPRDRRAQHQLRPERADPASSA